MNQVCRLFGSRSVYTIDKSQLIPLFTDLPPTELEDSSIKSRQSSFVPSII